MNKKQLKAIDQLEEAKAAAGMAPAEAPPKPKKIKEPKAQTPKPIKQPKKTKTEDLAMIEVLEAVRDRHELLKIGIRDLAQGDMEKVLEHIAKIHNKLRKNTKTLPGLVPIKL